MNSTFRIFICTLLQCIMRLVWYSGCLIKGRFSMVKVLIKKVSWISYYSPFCCYDCNQWRRINCLTPEDYFNLRVNQNYSFLYAAKWQYLLFQGCGVITEYITERSGVEDWGHNLLFCFGKLEVCCFLTAQADVLSAGIFFWGFVFHVTFCKFIFSFCFKLHKAIQLL